MKVTRAHKIELKPKVVGPVELDECVKCRGVWFDKDELRQAKDITDSDLNWMDFEIWKHEDSFKAMPSEITCPVCSTKTQKINYGATAIEVDYCPSCQGVMELTAARDLFRLTGSMRMRRGRKRISPSAPVPIHRL